MAAVVVAVAEAVVAGSGLAGVVDAGGGDDMIERELSDTKLVGAWIQPYLGRGKVTNKGSTLEKTNKVSYQCNVKHDGVNSLGETN
jgi:hypothetical protein